MKLLKWVITLSACIFLAACGATSNRSYDPNPVPNPTYKVGKPYVVAGKTYRPEANPNYDKVGLASWYGSKFHGRKTANGDVFNMNALTAAHTTLPMPSYVRVTNLDNGRWLILQINDRGPFVGGRIIDVSRRSAQLLGFEKKGVTRVRVQAVNEPRGELPHQQVAHNKPTKRAPLYRKEAAPKPAPKRNVVVEKIPPTQTTQAKPTQTGNKKIYVQVGAFSDPSRANKVKNAVAHISDTKVEPVDVNGQNLFRVRVGPHPTLELAEIILGRILSLGHNTARIVSEY